MVSGIEIARRAGGKRRYRESPNWAIQPLLRLVEAELIETDSNNHYRLKAIEKSDSQQSVSIGVIGPRTPHWSVATKNVSPGVRRSKRILHVDDDKHWREVVSAFLEGAGYEVLGAQDASEALRLAEGVNGLIILDLDLGGEDGLMLLKFFKRNQPDVPVIIYTGLSHDGEAIRAMLRQGADQYVRKGSLEELHKAIQRAVREIASP